MEMIPDIRRGTRRLDAESLVIDIMMIAPRSIFLRRCASIENEFLVQCVLTTYIRVVRAIISFLLLNILTCARQPSFLAPSINSTP